MNEPIAEGGLRVADRPARKRKLLFWTILAVAACGLVAGGAVWHFSSRRGAYYEPSVGNKPFCGLVAVSTICRLHGVQTNLSQIRAYAGLNEKGTSLLGCKRALEWLGVPVEAVEFRSVDDLPRQCPILCPLRTAEDMHAVVLVRRENRNVVIDGPEIRDMDDDELNRLSGGMALVSGPLGNAPVGMASAEALD